VKVYKRADCSVYLKETNPKTESLRVWNAGENFKYIGERIIHKNTIYVVIATDSNGNNIGNNPEYAKDYFLPIYHTAPYRPIQPKPTYPFVGVGTITYSLTAKSAEYICAIRGVNLQAVKFEELDSDDNVIASSGIWSGNYNWCYELQNKTDVKVKITLYPPLTNQCCGIYTVFAADLIDLSGQCVQCPTKSRAKVITPSKYAVTGERDRGTAKIQGTSSIAVTVNQIEDPLLFEEIFKLIDQPVFIVPLDNTGGEDDPRAKYGYFSFIDIEEKCDGKVRLSADITEFEYEQFSTCETEISTPNLIFCCDLNNPDSSSPMVRASDFVASAPYQINHLNTDWEIYDGSGNLYDAFYCQEGENLYSIVRGRIDKGDTYTFKARFRATNGAVSPWASITGTVSNTTNHCIDQCIQPFCDNSCQLFMRLSKQNLDDDVDGRDWTGNVNWFPASSDNCYTAFWRGSDGIESNNIKWDFRYGKGADEVAISFAFAGLRGTSSTTKLDPFFIHYGSLGIYFQTDDNNAQIDEAKHFQIYMEKSDKVGTAGERERIFTPAYKFYHVVVNAKLSTRYAEVILDGVKVWSGFLNNNEDPTQNELNAVGEYKIGYTCPSYTHTDVNNNRGTMRGFSVFNRLLTVEEAKRLHSFYFR